jgi:hypothetical protein
MNYFKILFTPFQLPEVKFYMGKTAIGTPYFFPRRWVNATPERATKAALKEIEKIKQYNQINAHNEGFEPRKIKPFDEYYNQYLKYTYPVDKKIGFNFVGLGWKTKWGEDDYRYEYSPVWSFVFFGYQIAVMIGHKETDHYWTAWLYYERNTDKSLSKEERIKKCIKNFPLTYIRYKGNEVTRVNYYYQVLKKKYHKFIESERKAVFKFNGGLLALLCSECSAIIRTGKDFTEEELSAVKNDIDLPARYCDKCKVKNHGN